MRHKYSIGLDFGTLTARAVIVDVETGRELATSTFGYQDAIIDTVLPETGIHLPADFALQNPRDYQEAVVSLLRDILHRSGVCAEDVIGIGVDSTASTVLALDENYMPLCLRPEFKNNPHSWIKMWKHHSPQEQADRINEIAGRLNEPFLRRCGGKVSVEWYYPKMLETLEKAPDVFNGAAYFVELGDWIVYLLTGEKKRSSAIASLHANWDSVQGMPSEAFFHSLHPKMSEKVKQNAEIPIASIFSPAGKLTKEIAEQTGLSEHTTVSMADTDSPVALFSLDVTAERTGALILGTSSVFMLLSQKEHYIPGAMASVKDQMMPGFFGNMFGQSAVGDSFEWFVKNLVPYQYYLDARSKDKSVFDVMNDAMERLQPGDEHILAMDWFNGSRSLLQNASLSGVLVGMTLSTRPEQIYRALVESTAFGLKKILNAIQDANIPIDQIKACGGLARKSPAIMQIYADILELPIYTTSSAQTIGQGAAILGALAAGSENGGYDQIEDAVRAMKCPVAACYTPREEYRQLYRELYAQYEEVYRFFGKETPQIMQILRRTQTGR